MKETHKLENRIIKVFSEEKEMRDLSPMEIYKRAKHDGLWKDGSEFDGESKYHLNSKGQLFHEWMREVQSKFVLQVGENEDYLGNKKEQVKEMSDPKKVVINIPDGYVIDKDKSTFEEIVFKEIEIQPVDRFEELDMITGYFVDEDCKIYRSVNVKPAKHNRNIFPALKDAESSVALSMLLQLRKEVVGDWKPDYTDGVTLKYQIRRYGNGIDITQATSSYCKIDFPELEMAQRFLKKHEYLIGTYYQL
jgi:hypothetical protein